MDRISKRSPNGGLFLFKNLLNNNLLNAYSIFQSYLLIPINICIFDQN